MPLELLNWMLPILSGPPLHATPASKVESLVVRVVLVEVHLRCELMSQNQNVILYHKCRSDYGLLVNGLEVVYSHIVAIVLVNIVV